VPPSEAAAVERAMLGSYEPVEVRVFMDGISHWRKRYGRDREDPVYADSQIVHIAENLLKYQMADGGWPNNIDWLADIDPDTVWAIKGRRKEFSTFDNHNTFPQIDYLAKVRTVTGLVRYRRASERGLDYVFAEQRPSGGWRGWDVDAITYNDGVMVGIMALLRDVVEGRPQYGWVAAGCRGRAQEALDRAIDVTLRCQIVVDGVKTAWCQQHDHETLEPVRARTYELPSICPGESVAIVRFLMEISNPPPEVVAAIDAAAAWFDRSQIRGKRLKRIEIEPVRFRNHTASTDLVVVEDADAPSLWARFYEVETNRPFFCNRDGRKVYSLAEVALERRTGYGWYGRWPAHLLEVAYPAWKAGQE